MTKRIAWIDFAKGFVMIAIVWGHAIMPDIITANKFFAAFRMPFFFVMSGYLLNLDKWGGVKNYQAFAKKLFKRLLLPYYLAELLFYPIWFVVCHEMGFFRYALGKWIEKSPSDAFTAIFIGNGNDIGLLLGALWFLPALLCAEIIFVKLFNYLNELGTEIFTLGIVLAVYVGFNVNDLPFGLDIALVAQIFLLAGIVIRKYNFIERMSLRFCVVMTLALVIVFYFNERIDMNFRVYGNPLLFYAGGIAGSLLVMKLSSLTTGGKFFSLIRDCGQQSMMILVLHPIIANVFYDTVAATTNFPPEEFFTEPIIIASATALGVLIPLVIAKRFGKLPVLKYFCA